ncbi:MAG TPA: OmpA family protein [Cellvibrionaceae bacterium]
MLNTLKTVFTLIAVLGLLSGCSSSKKKQEAAPAAAPVVETPVSQGINVDALKAAADAAGNVFYFEFDSFVLTEQTRAALLAHAEYLKAAPRSLRLEGHADERGSREYNMALGEKRAAAVKDFLASQGVSSAVEVVSFGEEQPAEKGHAEGSWSKNRRVELK